MARIAIVTESVSGVSERGCIFENRKVIESQRVKKLDIADPRLMNPEGVPAN